MDPNTIFNGEQMNKPVRNAKQDCPYPILSQVQVQAGRTDSTGYYNPHHQPQHPHTTSISSLEHKAPAPGPHTSLPVPLSSRRWPSQAESSSPEIYFKPPAPVVVPPLQRGFDLEQTRTALTAAASRLIQHPAFVSHSTTRRIYVLPSHKSLLDEATDDACMATKEWEQETLNTFFALYRVKESSVASQVLKLIEQTKSEETMLMCTRQLVSMVLQQKSASSDLASQTTELIEIMVNLHVAGSGRSRFFRLLHTKDIILEAIRQELVFTAYGVSLLEKLQDITRDSNVEEAIKGLPEASCSASRKHPDSRRTDPIVSHAGGRGIGLGGNTFGLRWQ